MKASQREKRMLVLPFPSEKSYTELFADRKGYKRHLQQHFEAHPELFPEGFEDGFSFCGSYTSKKMKLTLRRIRLKCNAQTYQIRPSFAMPYMIGKTNHLAKALFFRQWGVPFWALSQAFGKNAMYWYRAYTSLGRHNLVGTTIKSEDKLPAHILCDEKHTRWQGKKAYIATTTANGCILGAALCQGADDASLEQGYHEFAQEVQELTPRYHPTTATIDGWDATKKALQRLFPQLTFILCFLHSWFSIKKRCRREKGLLRTIGKKVWEVYRSKTRAIFSQKIRHLGEWALQHLPEGSVRDKVIALCEKRKYFVNSYQHPQSPRTSNALDRLMDYQDRQLYAT